MTTKGKIVKGPDISKLAFWELLRLFSVDFSASQVASLNRMSRNSAQRRLRSRPACNVDVKSDEFSFGTERVKSKTDVVLTE